MIFQHCAKTPNKTVLHSNKRTIHGSVVCNDCCYGDLCNVEGCGSPAFPTTRGPVCFNCPHTLNPTDCHHVTVCGTNELCYIGERPLFGQRYFTSHCEDIHACNNRISEPIVFGKKRSGLNARSYTPCSGCCHGDLCNINCNASFTSGTVINTGHGTTTKPNGQETPGNYAFYVHHGTTFNGFLIFHNITTNEGSSYNANTGEFTCKFSGAYVFSWTTVTEYGRQGDLDLHVNDDVVGTSHTDSVGGLKSKDSSTGLVVVNLQVGDIVRLRLVNGTLNANYTTFAGWRLDQNVSFHAKVRTAQLRPHSSHDGLVFQDVVTNNGQPYLSGNGTFVCPVSGLYAFAFTIEAKHRHYMVYFYSNGGHKLNTQGVWADSSSGDFRDTSTTLQLFQLNAGDAIYLYSGDRDAKLEPLRSTYSGWLIQPYSGLSPPTPAFMEQLTSTSPDTHSNVLFTREALDTTGSFHYSTGYTVPKNGVYVFFWNMEAYNTPLTSVLVVNKRPYGSTVTDGRATHYDSGSNVAVLRLRANDIINIVQSSSADGDQTIISGYMLYE